MSAGSIKRCLQCGTVAIQYGHSPLFSFAEEVITSCPLASNISRFADESVAERLHAVERTLTGINKSLVFIWYIFRVIRLTIFKREVKHPVVFTGLHCMAVNAVVLKQGGLPSRHKL